MAPQIGPHRGYSGFMSSRRGWGEDGIFFEHTALCRDGDRHRNCPGRWRGVISLGFGPDGKRIRRKVSGKTRAVVQERLKALHSDLDSGVKASPNYTVRRAAHDWLAEGLEGRSANGKEERERPGADPDRDGRPVLHCRGGDGSQRAGPGDPPRRGP